MNKLLSKYESFIMWQARDRAERHADIDDFAQAGREAVWQAGEGHTDSFYKQRIKDRMKNLASRELYKHRESSADELFGNILWGEYQDQD